MTRTIFALVLLAASVAEAQDTIDLAQGALASGDARTALELARGHSTRDARTLVTIGRAHMALGDPLSAARFYRRALSTPGVRRREVLELYARARAELAIVRVDLQPGNADLEVDGSDAEWERGERILLLAPGPHTLVARAPGRQARTFSASLDPGSVTDVRLLLPRGDDGEPAEPISAARPPQLPRNMDRDLMTSALGLLGAGMAGIWASDRQRVVESACAQGRCDRAAGAELEERWASLHTGLSLGLLLGAQTNLVLSWASSNAREEMTWPRLAIAAAAFAATVSSAAGECGGDACGGSLALVGVGAGLGVLATQLGALTEDHMGHAFGIVVSGTLLAVTEAAIAMVFAAQPEADDRFAAYRETLPEGTDACASIAGADARLPAGELSHLRGICAQYSASEALTALSLGIGSALVTASLAAFLARILPRRPPADDVSVAVGPGGIALHGRM